MRWIGFCVATIALGVAMPASTEAANLGSAHGLTYMKKSVALKNGKTKAKVFAECPGNQVSVGGGSTFKAPGNEGEAFISSSSGSDPDGWLTEGYERNGSFKAKLTSWAVCAGSNAKVKKRTEQGMTGAPGPTSKTALCDSGEPVGGGFRASKTGDLFLAKSFPIFDPDEPNDPGWFAEGYHTMVTDRTYVVDVTCMRGADPRYPSGPSSSASLNYLRVIGCNPRESVISGGYTFNNGGGSAHIIDSRPRDLPSDKDNVPDDAWAITYHNDLGGTNDYYYAAVCIR